GYEREQGHTQLDTLTAMAQWCRGAGIRTKGHPLCWHEVTPPWLESKAPAEVRRLLMARITREVKGLAGLIDTWDVVNESVVMPRYKNAVGRLCRRIGRIELLKSAFAAAREANPKAELVLNDFDTTPRCEKVIADCIKAGVDFDVIGIQSHMHKGYWGAQRAWDVCERFAKFGRPLHFTELTILSGRLKPQDDNEWHKRHTDWRTTSAGEKRQAAQAVEFYRVLYSHPAVEAVTWWDFSDRGAWQGAPAGLVRKDMSPKGAYEALKQLVKGKWWTGELKLVTDPKGRAKFRGFLGDYTVRAGKSAGALSLAKAGKTVRTARLDQAAGKAVTSRRK
ncbi:MAG: endo-1,4-beta-xylanase, partial [Planctomycetes bacterium]|nr:endo-1,4-beta-xylanase [Planctomycetota bacterium]